MSSTDKLSCKFLFDNYSLTPIRQSDWSTIVQAMSDTRVTENLRLPFGPEYTKRDALSFIESPDKLEKNGKIVLIRYAIRDNEKMIGSIDMREADKLHRDKSDLKGEFYVLGYWLFPEYQKKGIMTKSVDVVCEIAKNELNSEYMIGTAFSTNLASQKVLERNGFEFIREIKKGGIKFYPREWRDERIYVKKL